MYNYIYFVSKPEIGLHILSYLKPENLEKPTKSTKNNIPELFWEGPQLQSQKKHWKDQKKQKKTIFWNSLGRTPHPEEYPNIVFFFFIIFFWFFQVFFWFCTFPIRLSNCTSEQHLLIEPRSTLFPCNVLFALRLCCG